MHPSYDGGSNRQGGYSCLLGCDGVTIGGRLCVHAYAKAPEDSSLALSGSLMHCRRSCCALRLHAAINGA